MSACDFCDGYVKGFCRLDSGEDEGLAGLPDLPSGSPDLRWNERKPLQLSGVAKCAVCGHPSQGLVAE